MKFGVLLVYTLALLMLCSCTDVNVEVRDSRTFLNANGERFVDVRINKNSIEELGKSGEALYLHVFKCDHERDSSLAFPLVSRQPVETEVDSAWMRFSVHLSVGSGTEGTCGFLSSQGYSLNSFSSGIFTINAKSELAS